MTKFLEDEYTDEQYFNDCVKACNMKVLLDHRFKMSLLEEMCMKRVRMHLALQLKRDQKRRFQLLLDAAQVEATKSIANLLEVVTKVESQMMSFQALSKEGEKDFNSSLKTVASSIARFVEVTDDRSEHFTSVVDAAKAKLDVSINNVVPPLMKALETINGTVDQVNVYLKPFIEAYNHLSDPIYLPVYAGSLYIIMEVVGHFYPSRTITIIKCLLGAIFSVRMGFTAMKYFNEWMAPSVSPQGDVTDWLQIVVQGGLFLMCGSCIDFQGIGVLVKSLASAVGNYTRLNELFSAITEWLKTVFEKIAGLFTNDVSKYFGNWLRPKNTVISALTARVKAINDLIKNDPMTISVKTCDEVTKLSIEIADYTKSIGYDKNNPAATTMKILSEKISVLQQAVAEAGMVMGQRTECSFQVLVGAPGVGKTYITDQTAMSYAVNACTSVEELAEVERSWKNLVYPWPDDKFHEMYKGQPIVFFPDLFTTTDAEGQPSEASALTYIVGDNPYQLRAASIDKKQKLWFISKMVVACTNTVRVHDTMFKSIRNPEATRRRLNKFCWYMYVADGFHLDEPLDPKINKVVGYEGEEYDYLYKRIDKNKANAAKRADPNVNFWYFRRFNMTTGTFADGKRYNFKSWLALSMLNVQECVDDGESKLKNQEADMAKMVKERLESLEKARPEADDVEFDEVGYKPFVKAKEHPDEEMKRLQAENVRLQHQIASAKVEDLEDPDIQDYQEILRQNARISNHNGINQILVSDQKAKALVKDGHRVELGANYKVLIESDVDYSTDSGYSTADVTGQDDDTEIIDRDVEEFDVPFELLWKDIFLTDTQKERFLAYRENFVKYLKELEGFDMNILRVLLFNKLKGYVRDSKASNLLEEFKKYVKIIDKDELIGNISKKLPIKAHLELLEVPAERLETTIIEAQIETKYNPFTIAVNKFTHFVDQTFGYMKECNKTLTNKVNRINSSIYDFGRQMWWEMTHNPFFSNVFKTIFFNALGAVTGVLSVFLVGKVYSHFNKVEEPEPDGRVNLDATPQGILPTQLSGDISHIDRFADNYCGFYTSFLIPSESNARHVRLPCGIIFLGGTIGVIVDHTKKSVFDLRDRKDTGITDIQIELIPYSCIVGKGHENVKLHDITFETSSKLEHFDMHVVKFKGIRNRPYLFNSIPPKAVLEKMLENRKIEGLFIERTRNEKLMFVGPERKVDVHFDMKRDLRGNLQPIAYTQTQNLVVNGVNESERLGSYEYPSISMRGRYEFFSTHAGYCSSPGFITDPRKNRFVKDWSRASQPWLVYFHTASDSLVPSGAPLYRELFQKWIDELESTGIKDTSPMEAINENLKIYEEITKTHFGTEGESDVNEVLLHPKVDIIDPGHQAFAESVHAFREMQRSQLEKTLLFNPSKNTRFPAILHKRNGKDPKVISRKDYGTNDVCLDRNFIEQVIEQVSDRFMTRSSIPKYRDPLNLDQCLFGDAAMNLNAMNWNSSAGFNLRVMKDLFKMDWKQKKFMLHSDGTVNVDSYEFIQKLVTVFDNKLRNGERLYSVNIDNLKDELLKTEKILESKTRLFCTNDFIKLILDRKYFGPFAGWIYENRINNGIAIGVVPYGSDWTDIVNKLNGLSDNAVFGDHSQYDKKMTRVFMEGILTLCTKYYGDAGSINELCRKLLFEDVVNSIHCVMLDGKLVFYSWNGGNTSGNFLTAILNSFVNICYILCCAIIYWLYLQNIDPETCSVIPINPVSDAVEEIMLGDDFAFTVDDNILPGYGFNKFKYIAKKFLNLDITDELKEGGEVPDYKSVVDGSFLGRGFFREEVNGRIVYRAPLREYSIRERMYWRHGKSSPEIEVAKIESSYLEASNRNDDLHEQLVKETADRCREVYGTYPRFTNKVTAQKYLYSLAKYKYDFNDFMTDSSDLLGGPDLISLLNAQMYKEEQARYVGSISADALAVPIDKAEFVFEGEDVVCWEHLSVCYDVSADSNIRL